MVAIIIIILLFMPLLTQLLAFFTPRSRLSICMFSSIASKYHLIYSYGGLKLDHIVSTFLDNPRWPRFHPRFRKWRPPAFRGAIATTMTDIVVLLYCWLLFLTPHCDNLNVWRCCTIIVVHPKLNYWPEVVVSPDGKPFYLGEVTVLGVIWFSYS